jgi:hypothetical protein
MRAKQRWVVAGTLLCGIASWGAVSRAEEDGFHATPRLGFTRGDHHVELPLELRWRWENWKAFVDSWSNFNALRTRFGLDYRYRDVFRLFVQGQQTSLWGLDPAASGGTALYSDFNGGQSDVTSVKLSQLFLEFQPARGSWVRAGREYVKMGTYVPYAENNWSFLAGKRLSQRLLGTVGWSDGERAYMGINARVELGGHVVHGFALEPTTGVLEIDDAYERNIGIITGGLEWTVLADTWLPDSELRAFFIAYSDTRSPARVPPPFFGDIELYTFGASWLGIYDLGPGRVDALLWGAFQAGDYFDDDGIGSPPSTIRQRTQIAGALIAEAGFQLQDVWSAPWLRLGLNYGSGDGDPSDGTRQTFFNVLPTNHGYYGLLDQFALQNLLDLLVQLRARPFPWFGVDLTYHRFWLASSADARWAGSGAFSRNAFGYVRTPSNGSTDLGHELDLTLSFPVHRVATLMAGYSRLWGGRVFSTQPNPNADWAYLQVELRY